TCSLSTAYIAPQDVVNALMPLQRRELNLFTNSKTLIEELVQNLRKAAKEASDAIVIFSNGVKEEVRQVRAKIVEDIQILRERVSEAVTNVTNRLLDSGVAVTECIVVTILVDGAVKYSNKAMEDMRNCTDAGSFVTIGSCLGSIALQADMKAAAFTAQVGLMVRV
ncbi:Efflux transporter, RND family, partial [Operophtera brumata]